MQVSIQDEDELLDKSGEIDYNELNRALRRGGQERHPAWHTRTLLTLYRIQSIIKDSVLEQLGNFIWAHLIRCLLRISSSIGKMAMVVAFHSIIISV